MSSARSFRGGVRVEVVEVSRLRVSRLLFDAICAHTYYDCLPNHTLLLQEHMAVSVAGMGAVLAAHSFLGANVQGAHAALVREWSISRLYARL